MLCPAAREANDIACGQFMIIAAHEPKRFAKRVSLSRGGKSRQRRGLVGGDTGWDLKVSPDARPVPEPTPDELANLRKVDQTGALRKK
jgi:glutaconate CoA-transferase subunit B